MRQILFLLTIAIAGCTIDTATPQLIYASDNGDLIYKVSCYHPSSCYNKAQGSCGYSFQTLHQNQKQSSSCIVYDAVDAFDGSNDFNCNSQYYEMIYVCN